MLRKFVPATGAYVADQPAARWSNRTPETEMEKSRRGSWSEKKSGWGLQHSPGGKVGALGDAGDGDPPVYQAGPGQVDGDLRGGGCEVERQNDD